MAHPPFHPAKGRLGMALAASLTLGACGGDDGPAEPPAAPTALQRCDQMATRANPPNTRITRTTLIEAGTTRADGATTGEFLPQHCIVQGLVNERTGVDGKSYAIGFELRLPIAWNNRFFYQGGGGNDGTVAAAIGRNTGATGGVDNALQRGFAVVSTDAGHQGANPLFGLDPLARVDHAYNAYDVTTVTAKALISGFYGKQPDKSYFVGCSGGGNQGLTLANRFPTYFDGVVVTAPSISVAKGASISVAYMTQLFNAIAPRDAAGLPIVSQAFSNADLTLVADRIKTRCDSADGLVDGLVSRPGACAFDPAELQCTGAKAVDCLSAPQVDALKKAFAGPKNSAGQSLYARWPWDPGIAAAGWRAWTLGTSTTSASNSSYARLMEPTIGYEFITPPDPTVTLAGFNFDRDPARMDAFDSIYGNSANTSLTPFKARGGKLMIIHGMADPIFSAAESQAYYEALATNNGGIPTAQAFARLFQVPGMTHCSGGPATDAYDGLAAMVDWVEKGTAPESIAARGTTALPGVSRPLCAFPKYARYNGSGDPNAAASFTCTQ